MQNRDRILGSGPVKNPSKREMRINPDPDPRIGFKLMRIGPDSDSRIRIQEFLCGPQIRIGFITYVFSWIMVFSCESGLPQTPCFPWRGTVWMVHNSNRPHRLGEMPESLLDAYSQWMPSNRSVGFVRKSYEITDMYEIRDWKDDIQIRNVDIFWEIECRST